MNNTKSDMCKSNILGGIVGSALALSITLLVVVLSVTQLVIEATAAAISYIFALVVAVTLKVIGKVAGAILSIFGFHQNMSAAGYTDIETLEVPIGMGDAIGKVNEVGAATAAAVDEINQGLKQVSSRTDPAANTKVG
jgi:hypothetical protein